MVSWGNSFQDSCCDATWKTEGRRPNVEGNNKLGLTLKAFYEIKNEDNKIEYEKMKILKMNTLLIKGKIENKSNLMLENEFFKRK